MSVLRREDAPEQAEWSEQIQLLLRKWNMNIMNPKLLYQLEIIVYIKKTQADLYEFITLFKSVISLLNVDLDQTVNINRL